MVMIPLAVRARAKLNLFLNVTGRREDGYHTLDSLFAFCALADLIVIRGADDLVLGAPDGPFAEAVERDGANLVMRAAELLRREAKVTQGARLELTKHIPVAAGLGGGSADAAAALAGLNLFWGLNWPVERLEQLSVVLGADVPACVRNGPVIAQGIGELLSDAPVLPHCGILLVNPQVPTPTPAVFRAFKTMTPLVAPKDLPSLPASFADINDLAATLAQRNNDLLPAALTVTPAIADVLAVLRPARGAAYAGLSGSGATCFALFATVLEARAAQADIRRWHPDWWTWSGGWE